MSIISDETEKWDNPQPLSIIGYHGGIKILLPPKKVTWFSFLQAGRLANSENGGWNFKKHWIGNGLNRLVRNGDCATFLSKWTERSLSCNTLPLPRKTTFMLKERKDAAKSQNRLSEERLADGNEASLNWKIFYSHFGHCCMTYELPLGDLSVGQLKADLVVFKKEGLIEIIELKRSGERGDSDSPLMALTESICYALQLLRCWEALKQEVEEAFEIKFDILRMVHLVLAAPAYWDRCKPGGHGVGEIKGDDISKLRLIVAAVKEAVRRKMRPRFSELGISLTLADVIDESKLERYKGDQSQLPPGSIVSRR